MAPPGVFSHLLVATNGSTLALAAMRTGVALARTCGARVTFVTSSRPFTAVTDDDYALAHRDEYESAMNETARVRLAQGEALARVARVPSDGEHAYARQPCEAILEAAGSRGCDLIVMASRGHRPLAGLLVGSQTLKVLTRSTLPVLACATDEPRPLHHLLVATDGSLASESAARAAIDLAACARARVTMVTCSPPALEYATADNLASYHERAETGASRRFHAGEEHAVERGVRLACEHLYGVRPYEKILDCAHTLDCDLIVMASHGHRGAIAMALGSETLKVLTHARVPVLVWRGSAGP